MPERKAYTIKAHGSERSARTFKTLEQAIQALMEGYRFHHRHAMTGVELIGPNIHLCAGEVDEKKSDA